MSWNIQLSGILKDNEIARRLSSVFCRKIEERCGTLIPEEEVVLPLIVMDMQSGLGDESFKIEDGAGGEIRIVGNDIRGCLYGIGRFLRDSRYEEGRFIPGKWRGASKPDKSMRGVYFATHFHNFFHDAPIEKIREYVEDIALWGFNHLTVWLDRHHYRGIKDPAAQEMIRRLRAVLASAKDVGLKIGIVSLANEGYADSPKELRANGATGRCHYGVELCPSKPEAVKLMLREFDEVFDTFADLSPDLFAMGPYDQGGCACEACSPWGCNGYLRIGEKVARLFKKRFPNGKVILSTWLFDYPYKTTTEWEGLSKAFAKRPDWTDYIQADSHERFPQYPLIHGVPGGLPLINFPEISMWEMIPWGGFGANPLPKRFQQLWNEVKDNVDGGFPYVEGIYADINLALYGMMYWSRDRSTEDALREYIAYEYSPDVAEDVIKVISIMEGNNRYRWLYDRKSGHVRGVPKERQETGKSLALLSSMDCRLPARARARWRWRILYLRALIEHELTRNNEKTTELCEEAFNELTRIYHAEKAEFLVQPPSLRNISATEYEPRWFHGVDFPETD